MPEQQRVDQDKSCKPCNRDDRVKADRAAQHDQNRADGEAPRDGQDHQPIGNGRRAENERGGKIDGG